MQPYHRPISREISKRIKIPKKLVGQKNKFLFLKITTSDCGFIVTILSAETILNISNHLLPTLKLCLAVLLIMCKWPLFLLCLVFTINKQTGLLCLNLYGMYTHAHQCTWGGSWEGERFKACFCKKPRGQGLNTFLKKNQKCSLGISSIFRT